MDVFTGSSRMVDIIVGEKMSKLHKAHKDFWTQILHAKFLFAQMMLNVFLITCILMKIDLEVIISLQIT